jgi:tight adherence protein C
MRVEVDPPFAHRVLTPMRSRALAIGRRITPDDWNARTRRKLDLAGNPQGWDPERVLAVKVAWAVVLGGGLIMLGLVAGKGAAALIVGGLFGVGAYFLPDWWLLRKSESRNDEMKRSLSDSLDLLTISVEAGLAFDAAMANVAANTTGPLAEEFQRTLQEMQLGTSRGDALRAMSKRTKLADLDYIVNALVQADSFGIPIADVLRVQSHEMRLKRTQKAEETAAKLPVKILFPLMLCIMPALFIVILGPAVIQIMDSFSRM